MRQTLLLLLSYFATLPLALACHGTGISLTSVEDNGDGTWNVGVQVCFGVSSAFADTDGFNLNFMDDSQNPITVNSIVSGGTYSYTGAGIDETTPQCTGSGCDIYPMYQVDASVSGTIGGAGNGSVVFTDNSQWSNMPGGTYTGVWYQDCGGTNSDGYVADPTPATNPCLSGAPAGDAPFIGLAANVCSTCVDEYGEWAETPPTVPTFVNGNAVATVCWVVTVELSADPSLGYVTINGGVESGDCDAVGIVSGDDQEVCTNPPADPSNTTTVCDLNGTTQGTAVVYIPDAIDNLLPVSLIAFDGRAGDRGNLLYWATASEENNSHFELERSINGIDFEYVGETEGYGNSSLERHYEFFDNDPPHFAYYRLKQVDFDGTHAYSTVVKLRREGGFDILQTAPVPVRDELNVVVGNQRAEDANVLLFDINGRLLQSFDLELGAGETNFSVNMGYLPAGMYLLSVVSGEKRVVRKIMK